MLKRALCVYKSKQEDGDESLNFGLINIIYHVMTFYDILSNG